MARVDLGSGKQTVRDLLRGLGRLRAPVELVIDGVMVAKLIPPSELSEAEKEQILQKGRAFVERARAHNRGVAAKDVAKTVARASKRVRGGR